MFIEVEWLTEPEPASDNGVSKNVQSRRPGMTILRPGLARADLLVSDEPVVPPPAMDVPGVWISELNVGEVTVRRSSPPFSNE